MNGVGFYVSLNEILRDYFPVDTTNWSSIMTTVHAIGDFLGVLEREGSIVLKEGSSPRLGETLKGTFERRTLPAWLDEADVSAAITGEGERTLREIEREVAESELRNSIIDTNNISKQNTAQQTRVLRTQTRIFWFTLGFTAISAFTTILNFLRDDSKRQLQHTLSQQEKLIQQIQSKQLPLTSVPSHQTRVIDSSKSGGH